MNTKFKNILSDLFSFSQRQETGFLSLELGKHKERKLAKMLEVKQKELERKLSAPETTDSSKKTTVPSTTTTTETSVTTKTKKSTKSKDKQTSVDKKDSVTMLREEISKLSSELETTRVSNLKLLFKTDVVTHSVVSTKVLEYNELYTKNKTEVETKGEQLYNNFITKKNGLSSINKDVVTKDVVTKELFLKKMLGEDVTSPMDRRLVVDVLNLYVQLKSLLHKTTTTKKTPEKVIKLEEDTQERKLLETILDKEFEYKTLMLKKQVKYLNKFKDVVCEHIQSSAQRLLKSVKDMVPSVTTPTVSTTTPTVSTTTVSTTTVSTTTVSTTTDSSTESTTTKKTPSSKSLSLNVLFSKLLETQDSYVNTLIHKFGHSFDFVMDKNVVSSIFAPHTGATIKGVVEKDEVMSFLSAKNNTTFIINKLISSMGGLHIENKVKVFLGYLLINMVFDDMLPLLAMTKKEDIVVKKKVVEGDKITYVEDKKTINFNLNKLHPCVVKNVLTRTITA